MSELELKIENHKAITYADIQINGIKSILDFEANQYSNLLRQWERLLNSLLRLAGDFHLNIQEPDTMLNNLRRAGSIKEGKEALRRSLEFLEVQFLAREKEQPFSTQEIERIKNVLFFRNRVPEEKAEIRNMEELFAWIAGYVFEVEQITLTTIKQRPLDYFDRIIANSLNSRNVSFSLYEDGISVIDREHDRLNNIYSVKHVFYNDTPMSISAPGNLFRPNSNTVHWDYLRLVITNSQPVVLDDSQQQINDELTGIISGTVSQEQTEIDKRFSYKRISDGLNIDLADSATGIKSFAILQLLLKEGLLNDKTLLILDEPEAHLHPQWIVVLLNKQLGAKFMIATHNPDMVSALRYITEKEGQLSGLRFYLAEKEENSEQYHYRDLGTDIESIFLSFNIALDRIDQYGI